MIYLIDGGNRDDYSSYLREMGSIRHEIFVETKGWTQLRSYFGIEFDQYDSALASYLVSLDENNRILGGLRMMPTIFGTFLGEQYSKYLYDPDYEFGADVWEMYRLFVNDSDWVSEQGHPVRRELMLSLIEFVIEQGGKKIIAVADSEMLKKLPPFWSWREIGRRSMFKQAHAMDGEAALVEIDVDAEMLSVSKKFMNYHQSTLVRAEKVLEPRRTVMMPEDFYSLQQWLNCNEDYINIVRRVVELADTNETYEKQLRELLLRAVREGVRPKVAGRTLEVNRLH